MPYTNQAESADLDAGSSTVKIGGNMVAIKGCNYSASTGDENGSLNGVSSGTIQGIAEFTQYSMDVMIEGNNACRHNDMTTNNDKNTTGMNMDSSGQNPDVSAAQGIEYIIKIVDDQTNNPIAGVVVNVTLPDNTIVPCKSRTDGIIKVKGEAPGPCTVTSSIEGVTKDDAVVYLGVGTEPIEPQEEESEPQSNDPSLVEEEVSPVCIANVTEHRVATDETLDILAQNAGITWQQLAMFNWDTKDPDEINEFLRLKVGCTNRTAEGNYMFNSEDFPGIIYIPELVTVDNLAENQEHIIRIKPLKIMEWLISS